MLRLCGAKHQREKFDIFEAPIWMDLRQDFELAKRGHFEAVKIWLSTPPPRPLDLDPSHAFKSGVLCPMEPIGEEA